MNKEELTNINDPAMNFFLDLNPELVIYKDESKKLTSALDKLHPKLVEIKKYPPPK